ncbi:acyltransferase, partial [Lactiplantibacillus mudanjiangensis]|uniref:acyltransferase n=1 Tax=Lactiplantibacillus mudanjiangensis TaxID=1296538 RepID=UPI00103136FB
MNHSVNKKLPRNSNIEFLRILSMILIVFHHLSLHGFVLNAFSATPSLNQVIGQFMMIGGKIGVDIFVMISGYFLVRSTFKLNKMINLEIQIWSYSILCFLILVILKFIPFSPINFIKSFFPVMYDQYWFATAYMVMYIFSPFLNELIVSLSKRNFQILIMLLFIITMVLPSFVKANIEGSSNVLFILLYFIGAYIRVYEQTINLKKTGLMLFWFGVTVSTILFFMLDGLGAITKIWAFNNHATHFFVGDSPFMLLAGIGIFLLALHRKRFSNKFINKCASASFGVYLLHDNRFLSSIIWGKIFHVQGLLNMPTVQFVLASLAIVAIIYTLGTLIELARIMIIGSFFNGDNILKLVERVKH